ncbi:hypothetical protein BDV93DRAFT_440373 [Ceratobasidium sp. AG-I]|nr:hypothetical protein BDV93DRAFT_440373 [Ceratobasidium sp. AG-I]
MAATKQNPIIFFDILSKVGPWSPNTWKTRQAALNYKRLPYRVEYVSYPDIESTFKKYGVPPTSDQAPQYTLPSSDPNGKPTYIADSFKIALYLDDNYPSPHYPRLFPPGARALHALFVERFTGLVMPLAPTMLPLVARHGFLDDRGEEYYHRTRQAKLGKSFAEMAEDGAQNWAQVLEKWDALGSQLDLNTAPDERGPFVMGKHISYADLMLGAAFYWIRKAEGGDMKLWRDISGRQDGRWKKLWNEVEKYTQESSEVS